MLQKKKVLNGEMENGDLDEGSSFENSLSIVEDSISENLSERNDSYMVEHDQNLALSQIGMVNLDHHEPEFYLSQLAYEVPNIEDIYGHGKRLVKQGGYL